MTIRHVVLFDYRPDAPEAEVSAAIARLNALPGQIDGIRDWGIHETVATRNGTHRFILISEFDDIDAVERYLAHPAHVAAVAANAPILRSFAENDYLLS